MVVQCLERSRCLELKHTIWGSPLKHCGKAASCCPYIKGIGENRLNHIWSLSSNPAIHGAFFLLKMQHTLRSCYLFLKENLLNFTSLKNWHHKEECALLYWVPVHQETKLLPSPYPWPNLQYLGMDVFITSKRYPHQVVSGLEQQCQKATSLCWRVISLQGAGTGEFVVWEH